MSLLRKIRHWILGWILSISIASFPTGSISALAHHGIVFEILDRDLRRFWEIEEVPQKVRRSPEEHQCEEHFRTHSHTPEGRYIVRLLFKNGPSISIGKSRSIVSSLALSSLGTTLKSRPNYRFRIPRISRRI